MNPEEVSFDDIEDFEGLADQVVSYEHSKLYHSEMISNYFNKRTWLEELGNQYITSLKKVRGASQYKYVMKQFILNALINESNGNITCIPLDKMEYLEEYLDRHDKTKKRVGFMSKSFITYPEVKQTIKWLENRGIIEVEKGSPLTGMMTTFWLTEKFKNGMDVDFKQVKSTLVHREESPYIVLNKKVGKFKIPCPFTFNKELSAREELLKNWHELSQSSTVSYSGGELNNTKLVSMFCRGDETKKLIYGGRFYALMPYRGKSYQQLNTRIDEKNPVALRPTLKINGNDCVELDFKSMHIAMALANDGVQIDLSKDFYTIEGWDRGFIKLMF